MTGEDLTVEDLIDIKTDRTVRPRPPTLTSIPSLLSTLQNEWDALALESFTIRQQLQQTRQELTTALYQNDAAVRVIARLTKERDEARDALSKVTVSAGVANNGDKMQVDSQGLPEHLVEKIDATHAKYEIHHRQQVHKLIDYIGSQRPEESVQFHRAGLLERTFSHMFLSWHPNLFTQAAARSLWMLRVTWQLLVEPMGLLVFTPSTTTNSFPSWR